MPNINKVRNHAGQSSSSYTAAKKFWQDNKTVYYRYKWLINVTKCVYSKFVPSFYRERDQMLTFISCKFQSTDSNNHISVIIAVCLSFYYVEFELLPSTESKDYQLLISIFSEKPYHTPDQASGGSIQMEHSMETYLKNPNMTDLLVKWTNTISSSTLATNHGRKSVVFRHFDFN